jgi:hypothetical protein
MMEDSGSVTAVARFMTEKLGKGRAILAAVLAGAVDVTLKDGIRNDRDRFPRCSKQITARGTPFMAAEQWRSIGPLVAGAIAMVLIVIVWWGYHAGHALNQ